MTRNKEEAQKFWMRLDSALAKTDYNLYDLASAGGVPYKSILSWRQKHLFPDLETASLMAKKMSCTLDSLMGEKMILSEADIIYNYMKEHRQGELEDIRRELDKKTGNCGVMVG